MVLCRECLKLFEYDGHKELTTCPHCSAFGCEALGYSFEKDEEKMRDFGELSRDDFLQSYSYLNERDYAATVAAVGFGWVCEKLGWSYNEYKQDGRKYSELENHSPAGEDIVVTVWHDGTWESFVDEIKSIYDNFDAEEHVFEMLEAKKNGFKGVPDVKTLVSDADEIEKMYLDLVEALSDKMNEMRQLIF